MLIRILNSFPPLSSFSISQHSSRPYWWHPVSTQSWQVFYWLINTGVSMCRSSLKKFAHEFVPASQQYPACLVCLTWMVCEIGGKWPYRCCFVGCCFLLLKIACNILVLFPSRLLPNLFIKVKVKQPYSCSNTATVWKISHFTREMRLPYSRLPFNTSPCFSYTYISSTFCRWDIPTEVCDLIN